MKQFDDKFTINDTVISLASIDVLDPLMVKHDNKFYQLSKEASRRLAYILGLHNYQFSKRLYDSAPDLWNTLKDRLADTEDVVLQLKSHSAVSLDEGRILAIVPEDVKLSKIFSKFNEFITTDKIDSKFEIDTDEDVLRIISIDKSTNCGVIVTYWIKSNWLEITDCSIVNNQLLINPATEYSFELDSMDTLNLLSVDDLIGYSNNSMPHLVDEYIDLLKITKVSLNEITSIFKKSLGIKLKSNYEEELDDIISKCSDMDNGEVIDILQSLLQHTYTMNSSVNSNFLKKATTFKDLYYDELLTKLTKLYEYGLINLTDLAECQYACYTSSANYAQLELRY